MKDKNITKPVSFRLSAEVFEALQIKGEGMGLSPHEVASMLVQGNYKDPIAIQGEVVKEPVTSGYIKLVQTEVSKRVFRFNLEDLKTVFSSLANGGCLHYYICEMEIGAQHNRLTRISDDGWEVLLETKTLYKECV
jgi:hypothetical protein